MYNIFLIKTWTYLRKIRWHFYEIYWFRCPIETNLAGQLEFQTPVGRNHENQMCLWNNSRDSPSARLTPVQNGRKDCILCYQSSPSKCILFRWCGNSSNDPMGRCHHLCHRCIWHRAGNKAEKADNYNFVEREINITFAQTRD